MSSNRILQRAAIITRAADSEDIDERTLTARLVPYDEVTEIIPGYFERFAPGSVVTDDIPPMLFRDHEKPIGAITAVRDEEDGCYIDAKISATPLGDETLQLIRDEVLTRVSIGFIIEDQEKSEPPEGNEGVLYTIKRALLREGSVVPFPAYPNAKITAHRNETKENNMTETSDFITRADFQSAQDETRAGIDELARKIETMPTAPKAPAVCNIRSFGEYVQLAVAGDERATRAFEGVTSDAGKPIEKPAWLGRIERDMRAKQPILNLFTHKNTLPAKGMTLEYGEVGEPTFKVGAQTAEGEPLQKTTALSYKTAAVSVETIGGWGELSRQAVERAQVNLVDDLFKASALSYANYMEARMRATVLAAMTTAETSPAVAAKPIDANGWLDAVLDLKEAYEDSLWPLDGLLVSKAVFRSIAKMEGKNRALQIAGAPENKDGVLTVSVPQANLYGLPVVQLPKWDGAHAVGYASSAATCLESPGAPLRLSDEDVTNLTKAFSVYGYAAFYVSAPSAFKAINLKA